MQYLKIDTEPVVHAGHRVALVDLEGTVFAGKSCRHCHKTFLSSSLMPLILNKLQRLSLESFIHTGKSRAYPSVETYIVLFCG